LADLNAIGTAIRDAITVPGLNAYYPEPAVVLTPALVVEFVGLESEFVLGVNATSDPVARYDWELRLEVGHAQGMTEALRALGEYVRNTGGNSIRAKLVADRTLGSLAHSLFIGEWDRPHREDEQAVPRLTSRLPVTVWA